MKNYQRFVTALLLVTAVIVPPLQADAEPTPEDGPYTLTGPTTTFSSPDGTPWNPAASLPGPAIYPKSTQIDLVPDPIDGPAKPLLSPDKHPNLGTPEIKPRYSPDSSPDEPQPALRPPSPFQISA